jgi:hypothetical protein
MTRTEETGKPSNYGPKTLQILNSTVDHQRRFDPRKAEEFLVDLSKDGSFLIRSPFGTSWSLSQLRARSRFSFFESHEPQYHSCVE